MLYTRSWRIPDTGNQILATRYWHWCFAPNHNQILVCGLALGSYIYINKFAKAYAPTLRIPWVHIDGLAEPYEFKLVLSNKEVPAAEANHEQISRHFIRPVAKYDLLPHKCQRPKKTKSKFHAVSFDVLLIMNFGVPRAPNFLLVHLTCCKLWMWMCRERDAVSIRALAHISRSWEPRATPAQYVDQGVAGNELKRTDYKITISVKLGNVTPKHKHRLCKSRINPRYVIPKRQTELKSFRAFAGPDVASELSKNVFIFGSPIEHVCRATQEAKFITAGSPDTNNE